MKKNVDNIKKNLTHALELPMDVALDLPKIIIMGDLRVDITNHKGIIEYGQDLIRINSKLGMIRVVGEGMEIKNILMEEISIIGQIQKVEILG